MSIRCLDVSDQNVGKQKLMEDMKEPFYKMVMKLPFLTV